MNEEWAAELATRYYRLALARAARRDLSGAVVYARWACWLDECHEKADRLLGLCLYELGEWPERHERLWRHEQPEQNEQFERQEQHDRLEWHEQHNMQVKEDLAQIQVMRRTKKWRGALHRAASVSHQSVRILNIQGCLYAAAKRYGAAARMFARALEKDCGNSLALAALTEVLRRQKRWGVL